MKSLKGFFSEGPARKPGGGPGEKKNPREHFAKKKKPEGVTPYHSLRNRGQGGGKNGTGKNELKIKTKQ